jgi:hypothetical protein
LYLATTTGSTALLGLQCGTTSRHLVLLRLICILRVFPFDVKKKNHPAWRRSTHSTMRSFQPASVTGQIQDTNFGRTVSASPPRLVQIAVKISF